MKTLLRFFIILVFLSAIFLIPNSALADVAPPSNPPGSNLAPGEEITQVRMVAETVLIDVQSDSGEDGLGRAKVTADFTMRNLGSETESMAARFPVGASDGRFNIPEITDFKVRVNGNSVSTRQIEGEDPYLSADSVPWAEFDVIFPPGEDVGIIVTYTIKATGYYPFSYFTYILSTGAGWKDTIGSADIIVRFPYEVSPQNVIINPADMGWSESTPGAALTGNEIRWRYNELEPTPANNIRISFVSPEAWKKVLTERDNINQNPNDGEAWGRLGKNYKEIIQPGKGLRVDEGGLQLYDLSVHAYEKSLELLPNDALWHAGFAELLALPGIWGMQDYPDETLRAAEEMNRALELDSQNEKIIEILDWMTWDSDFAVKNSDGSYSLLWLTATPFPATIAIETEAAPKSTPVPVATAPLAPPSEPTDEPASKPASPICGSAAALPLALVAFIFARRKQI